jgi:hypothetical protein
VDINTIWETIPENIKLSAKKSLGCYDAKQHKSQSDKWCSKLLDQRKQCNSVKLVDISRTKRGNTWETKLTSLHQTVRTMILESHNSVVTGSKQNEIT